MLRSDQRKGAVRRRIPLYLTVRLLRGVLILGIVLGWEGTDRFLHAQKGRGIQRTEIVSRAQKGARPQGDEPRRIEPRRDEARRRAPESEKVERERERREEEPRPEPGREIPQRESVRSKPGTARELPIIEGRVEEHPGEVREHERVREEKLRQEAPVRASRRVGESEGVKMTLERFRENWVKGNSEGLLSLLSERSRVRIAIDSKNIDDSFGKGQAQYILKEYLSSAENRDLSFSRFRVSPSDGVSAYGVGVLKMRDRKSGRTLDKTVYLSLEKEGPGWAIREIRITE